MASVDAKLRASPRWKEILDQVQTELPSYAYGSEFYTITEICDRFRVSRITAIRVLNELASKNLIQKLPGKGNVVRLMSTTASVRLIVPSASRRDYLSFDPVNRRTIEGITTAAKARGLDFDTISEAHLTSLFPRANASFGFLVPKPVSRETRQFLRANNLPHVLVDPWEHYKSVGHARIDRFAAGYIATRHLLDLGHRRIAWITGPISSPNFRSRLTGYRAALKEEKIPFVWSLITETTGMDAEQDYDALTQLLGLHRPPTAIILGDDSRGVHVLAACHKAGIRVPEDLSLVGYPNNSEARLTNPPLTVIDAMFERVGEASVKRLLDLIATPGLEPAVAQTVVEPQLIVRGSTAPVATRRGRRANTVPVVGVGASPKRVGAKPAILSSSSSSIVSYEPVPQPLVSTADR
jgi:DNA-binding LacI/PurR family transcriptional regulator